MGCRLSCRTLHWFSVLRINCLSEIDLAILAVAVLPTCVSGATLAHGLQHNPTASSLLGVYIRIANEHIAHLSPSLAQ